MKFKNTFSDPRFNNLFYRVYIFGKQKVTNLESNDFYLLKQEEYQSLRLLHAIPDFSIDAISNKSLLTFTLVSVMSFFAAIIFNLLKLFISIHTYRLKNVHLIHIIFYLLNMGKTHSSIY